jgi:hypothetical protein
VTFAPGRNLRTFAGRYVPTSSSGAAVGGDKQRSNVGHRRRLQVLAAALRRGPATAVPIRDALRPRALSVLVVAAPALLASCGGAEAAPLDGAHLSPWWAFPFLGLLASIGLGPVIAEAFWHRHYGKIAFLWAAGLLAALTARFGPAAALAGAAHSLIGDYLPFILMMYALYTAAGGVVLRGSHHGRPAFNTLLLAIGTIAGSLIGVTAASMIMIRPLLRANNERRRNAHIVVFFIFLVSNIGGA